MDEGTGLDEIIKYIRNNRGCVLSTWQEDFARGTPVYYFSNGTTIYIFSEGGGKFPNIRKNPKVCVGIYTSKPLFGVQLFGIARIIPQDDPLFDEEVEKSGFLRERQFPGEKPPYFLKIIKVEAQKIVYWCTKHGSAYKIIWDDTLPPDKEKIIYDKLIFFENLAVKHFYPEKIRHENPLIFVHDAFQGSWAFKYFQDYFAHNGWENYAINLRGHFVSQFSRTKDKPAGKVNGKEGIEEYVDDLKKIVSEIKKDPVIIGHGMGGLISLKFAEQNRLKGLVLLNSLPPKSIFDELGLGRKISRETVEKEFSANNSSIFSINRKKGEKLLFRNGLATQDAIFEACSQLCEESPKAFLETHLGEVEIDREKIKTPLFVLGSQTDPTTGARINKSIAETYKAQGVKLFQKIDHNMMLDKDWGKYAKAIEEFLHNI